jgi:calcineurin-like phosphoesterase family protein
MDRLVWIITDTLFFHKNMEDKVKWSSDHDAKCFRPKNFTHKIKAEWNRLVNENDLVYHLGDVAFREGKLKALMSQLTGTKILIKGNHDKKPFQYYMERGFAAVCDSIIVDYRTMIKSKHKRHMKYTKAILSHKPVDIPEGVDINIHGHFHNIPRGRWEPELVKKLTVNHYRLALEETKYRPVLLNRALIDGKVFHGTQYLPGNCQICYLNVSKYYMEVDCYGITELTHPHIIDTWAYVCGVCKHKFETGQEVPTS